MNIVEVFNESLEKIEEIEVIKSFLLFALDYEKIKNVEFSVILVDNEKIREINKKYRGIFKETDVISFALEDEKDMVLVSDYRILGDIYISFEKAKEQAKEYGHSLKRELCFLSIHGLLHLLSYDHMKKEEEKVMFAKQEEILNAYGVGRNVS